MTVLAQETLCAKQSPAIVTPSVIVKQDLPEWLEELTDNLNDTEVPAPANTSQDSDSERPRKVALRKHSVCTHLPKDQNCEVCLRISKSAPCRRRSGEAAPRAEKFGDLITAGHKVLNEEAESRNNHRCAVVVQESATQWIARGKGSSRRVHKRRRRTGEGPEPACVRAPMSCGWHMQGGEG